MTSIQIFAFMVLPALLAGFGYLALLRHERASEEAQDPASEIPSSITSHLRMSLSGAVAGALVLGIIGILVGNPDRLVWEIVGAGLGFLLITLGKLRSQIS